jgi:hypothetical protein
MKTNRRIQSIEQQIEQIKAQLQRLGPMRPGSLSRQYNVCGKAGCRCKDPQNPQRHGPYYKLSYAHKGRFSSQFVRREDLPGVRVELANFKRFRKLTENWVALSLQLTKAKHADRS